MTNREFFTAVIYSDVAQELKDFATEGIAKLDKKNASRSDKPTKAQIENAPLLAKILEVLSEETPMLSTDVALELGITTNKATGLLGTLYKEGKVDKVDVKVPKKGTQKGWFKIVDETTFDAEDVIYNG